MSDIAKFPLLAAAAVLAAALAGCGSQGGTADDRLGRFLVAPDKFSLYNCPELAEKAETTAARERELQALIARAGEGSGGRMVSAVAYRPEYLTVHGEMNELRAAAAAKKCDFVPGEVKPGAPASGAAAR
jgi:hypothetical protein